MLTRAAIVLAVAMAPGCDGGSATGVDAGVDASGACTPVAGAAAERVTTTSGVVHGARDGETWAYKGVPYAAPPLGALRFAVPALWIHGGGNAVGSAVDPVYDGRRLFDTILVGGQPYHPTATDLALSAAIQGYWTRFARTGDPAGSPA